MKPEVKGSSNNQESAKRPGAVAKADRPTPTNPEPSIVFPATAPFA